MERRCLVALSRASSSLTGACLCGFRDNGLGVGVGMLPSLLMPTQRLSLTRNALAMSFGVKAPNRAPRVARLQITRSSYHQSGNVAHCSQYPVRLPLLEGASSGSGRRGVCITLFELTPLHPLELLWSPDIPRLPRFARGKSPMCQNRLTWQKVFDRQRKEDKASSGPTGGYDHLGRPSTRTTYVPTCTAHTWHGHSSIWLPPSLWVCQRCNRRSDHVLRHAAILA